MKKFSLIFTALLALMMSFSCRRASDNGKLDGYWKIYEIYYIADGTTVSPESRFLAIQLELIQLESHDGASNLTGILSYSKGADSFSVDFATNPSPQQLFEFGFSSPQSVVHIDKADGKKLVLSTDIARISCRKY